MKRPVTTLNIAIDVMLLISIVGLGSCYYFPNTPLQSPSNIEVRNVTSNSFELHWPAIENAVSYEIYISPIPDSSGEIPVFSDFSEVVVTSLQAGTDYYVRIVAASEDSYSSPSNQIRITTLN